MSYAEGAGDLPGSGTAISEVVDVSLCAVVPFTGVRRLLDRYLQEILTSINGCSNRTNDTMLVVKPLKSFITSIKSMSLARDFSGSCLVVVTARASTGKSRLLCCKGRMARCIFFGNGN